MEKSQLEQLTIKELKYYTNSKRITSPINTNKQELIGIILGHQAKQLCDLARKAVAQVTEDTALGADILNVDLDRLLPHTSAYSSQAGQTSVDKDSVRRGELSAATGGGGVRAREEPTGDGSSSKRQKKVRVHSVL